VTEPVEQSSTLNERVLLRELNHRINNEFVSAIYAISAMAVRSENVAVKHALNDVVELLHQYADVHRALSMPDRETLIDAAGYLQKLCLSITRSKLGPLAINLVFFSRPFAAAVRPLLAARADCSGTPDQCGEARSLRRGRGRSKGGIKGRRDLREVQSIGQRLRPRGRQARTRFNDHRRPGRKSRRANPSILGQGIDVPAGLPVHPT
jgi:hypothetical protein